MSKISILKINPIFTNKIRIRFFYRESFELILFYFITRDN